MAKTPSALSPPISLSRLFVTMTTMLALILLTNEGNPMMMTSAMIDQSGLKEDTLILYDRFFLKKKKKMLMPAEIACPRTVARAAPETPMCRTMMNSQQKTILALTGIIHIAVE